MTPGNGAWPGEAIIANGASQIQTGTDESDNVGRRTNTWPRINANVDGIAVSVAKRVGDLQGDRVQPSRHGGIDRRTDANALRADEPFPAGMSPSASVLPLPFSDTEAVPLPLVSCRNWSLPALATGTLVSNERMVTLTAAGSPRLMPAAGAMASTVSSPSTTPSTTAPSESSSDVLAGGEAERVGKGEVAAAGCAAGLQGNGSTAPQCPNARSGSLSPSVMALRLALRVTMAGAGPT